MADTNTILMAILFAICFYIGYRVISDIFSNVK